MFLPACLGLISPVPQRSSPPATPSRCTVVDPYSMTSELAQPAPSPSPGGRRAVTQLALLVASSGLVPPAMGADAPRRWVSGRSDPIRKTSKDSVEGTKKDPKYLSCLNDCVPRCLGPPGSQTKERIDCIAECQDECCFTYQQCTYTIR